MLLLDYSCMKKAFITIIAAICYTAVASQSKLPCSYPKFRQFDFWIGEWEVFGKNNNKAGDSKISVILDSCVILEEWTSASLQQGLRYAGKSFNSFNKKTKQWQQTWVDNTGATTEYLTGKFENNAIIFTTNPFAFSKDTLAIRKLSFFNVEPNKIRQLGEISKDGGATWLTEFDLEYRRKKPF